MNDAKKVYTPISSTESPKLHDGSLAHDATTYRQALDSLQYLSLTRPDIMFAVNKVSQNMHKLSILHWVSVKRILRYLKGTTNYGLFFNQQLSTSLNAFADVD
jgi:hypothetical protein